MADWKKYKVPEFASLVGGGTPDTKNSRYWEGDISWICPSDLTGYTNVYISKGANSITSAGLQNSSAKMLPKETVLVSSRAPVGYVAIAANPLCTNQGFRSLIIKEKVADPKFIYYSLKVYRSVLEAFASGPTFPELSGSSFKKIEIPLPLLPEQQRIASILSAYDVLIENSNKRIALLKQMAEQIYKEWFVRMRFPGYENAEFEKGLPKGWELKQIKDFGKVVTGKTPSTFNSRYYNGQYLFIKTPDMHGNVFVLQTEETLTEDGFSSQKSQILPANSICVSCIGTGGIVSITPSICMTNQQINSLILKNQKELEFLFFTFRGLKTMIEMFGSTGATMTNLSKGKFENLKFIKPNDELIERFCLLTKPMLLEIKNLSQQQSILKQTRDLLLPRLISGKLRVKEIKEPQ